VIMADDELVELDIDEEVVPSASEEPSQGTSSSVEAGVCILCKKDQPAEISLKPN